MLLVVSRLSLIRYHIHDVMDLLTSHTLFSRNSASYTGRQYVLSDGVGESITNLVVNTNYNNYTSLTDAMCACVGNAGN